MTLAGHFKAVVLLLLIHCLLFLPLFRGRFMFGLCFVMHYLVSYLVLQSSRWGREGWLLYFNCVLMSLDSWCSVSLPHDAVG